MFRRFARSGPGLPLAAVLALAACAAPPPPDRQAALPVPAPSVVPAPPDRREQPDTGLRADDLFGAPAPSVSGWLGAPTLLRREPPAEIWQYAGPACTLHLYLYREADGTRRVAHVESVDRRGAGLTNADCLATLQPAAARLGRS